MRKICLIVLVIFFILTNITISVFAQKVISLGHTLAPQSPFHMGAVRFKELVEERTDGSLEIQIFPQSQLGWERDLLEGIQIGSVGMCISATGPLAIFVKEFELLDYPFLFKNIEHMQWFMYESDVVEDLKKAAEPHGFKILALGAPVFRYPFLDRPIEKPSDFQGVKIRTMGVPIHRESYNILGANVTSTDFAELYGAIQMGTVDGAENAHSSILAMKFYEVVTHVSEIPIFTAADTLVISLEIWNSFTNEQKEIVQKSAIEAWEYHDNLFIEMDQTAKEKMVNEYGIEIIENITLQPFIDRVQPIYEKYLADQPDFVRSALQDIQNEAKNF